MEETTLVHSPERPRTPQLSPAHGKQASLASSRGLITSLVIFMLSFAVLFVGPALVLRLMAAAVENPIGSSVGYAPNAHAAQATVTIFQEGVYPTAAYTGTDDTYINQWNPTLNGGTEVRVVVGQTGAWRSLLYFDLTPGGIPAGATVITAELALYCYDRNMVRSMDIEVYQVKRPWTELGATWEKATATDLWGSAGCNDPITDRFPTPAFTTTVSNYREWHRFDVTSIVQNWVSDPASNKGFLLIGPTHAVIYYYASSQYPSPDVRPQLIVSWTSAPTPTPTPTQTTTPVATPTHTATPTPTPTVTPAIPPVVIDNTSACYSDYHPTQWQTAIGGGGYNGSYRYETTSYLTGTASFSPCLDSPLPQDGIYEVQAHWSVHAARPVAVPYTIHYYGGNATIAVDQTKDANGATVPDFSPSGWYSLGYYPFRAGTAAANGEYVELNTSSAGDTCADAVRWVLAPDQPGPPYTLTVTADPTEVPSDGISTSTIMVTVTDQFGNMVADGTMVGLTTTQGVLPYSYVQAESASVAKSGSWNTGVDPSASGGAYIYSDNPGDEVSWTFSGEAVSFIYITNVSGGFAEVSIDGIYLTTINFASGSVQWQVERQLTNALTPGTHTLRIRHAGGGRIWLDAFRSGTVTTNGVATAALRAPAIPGTATVHATAIGADMIGSAPSWPHGTTIVSFPGPSEVWVDDDYCSTCYNDGHTWNYDAFNTIQGGVNGVLSNGIVHVLPGTYHESVTIAKPLQVLGSGSSAVFVTGTGAGGSRGFYIDRADNVTIQGVTVRNFDTGIYLRGTGTGSGPRVYNATIVYNAFESNQSYALWGSYVYTSTICSNDIALGNNGIYLENAHGNTICYNDIFNNLGFGVKLNAGSGNSIDNNEINNNQNVGIELVGQTQQNGVYGNNLQDLWWDGILISGTVSSDVYVAANTIANTNLAWLDAGGTPPDSYHNLGGIVLMGITTGSEVRQNRIAGVSNALGNRADAAGVYLFNNTAPITVESNLIQNGIGHGIYITACTGIPVIHGNSIYGNSLFGLNNRLATRVHAEGNWWGRNAPTFGPSTPADIRTAASAYYSPPISLTLTAAPTSIPANGVATSTITATASGGGYYILDGTWITFTSDLNTSISPAFAAFGGGYANTILTAGTLAGVATITGTAEPGIEGQIVTVTLTAGAPHSLSLVAVPNTVPNSCDSAQNRSVVTATVRDLYANPVQGVPVTFTSNALGSVSPSTGTTMAGTGIATTTFTAASGTGTAIVTATAGTTLTTATYITVTAGPPSTANILADPASLPANGVATSTITVTLQDCLGYPVPDGTMVAFTTTLGTIVNQDYVEAESAAVITSTGWTMILDGSASGGAYIRTSTVGAVAYWLFRGEAVSLIYRRFSGGGVMRVRVDGGTPVDIDTNGSSAWLERVIAINLNPAIIHQIEVSCLSGQIRLDAFRAGTVTSGGIAQAILRAPALVILGPQVYTGTVYATSRLGHPVLPNLVVTTVVTFTQADIVWVNDDWVGLPNGTNVTLPPEHGSGIVTIGSDAFDTIPKGVAAVKEGGTVQVLTGTYASPVVITKTLNLLGDGPTDTFITGSGTGNGIQVERFADGVTIEGFTIRNFGYGVHLDGRSANRIEGLTFANNVITGCATGAITATYLNNGYFADNVLYNNTGFGLDLYVGDPNRIVNNHIYGISGFGLRIRNALGTEISYNNIHDIDWNGIVVGNACTNTLVLHNTVRTTNRVNSPSGFNEGGIVLYNTTNTTVEYNEISDVRDAGGSTDTAGIWIGGTDTGAAIHYNRALYNTNDGVLLWGFNAGSPPVINCNHIYGNLRFGIRNTQVTTINAEGNWWGRNTPTTGTSAPRDIYRPPANVDYIPWITVVLTPSQPTVSAGGSAIVITATGSGGNCFLLDTTPITFTSSLGLLGDPPRSIVTDTMSGGQVTVLFTPGTIAGTAIITGTVPNAGVTTTTVTILPLGPALIDVTAYPHRITVGGTAAITANVRDMYGNPVLPGTLINFDTSLGTVSPTVSGTDATGVATSTLYAGITPGFATVWAYWGLVMDFDYVEIIAGPPFTITSLIANPSTLPANGLATARLTATVKDQYNNLVPDGTMVGFTTTAGSLIHDYVEAESASVDKSAGWSTVSDASASGGQYIQTSTAGASVRWGFRGEAVSLIYRRFGAGGIMLVRIDGATPLTIDTSGSAAWVEQVIATDLDPDAWHEIEVAQQSGTIRLDAFRSGAATRNGQATAWLTSAPLPPVVATIWATGIDLPGIVRLASSFPTRTVTVPFLAPTEVWVDDDYCSMCPNDGHQWGFDAFDNIPDGVTAVMSGGTVHVADGMYTGSVTVNKPVYLDGAGSGGTTALVGTGTGNGIFVSHLADGTTIEGFAIRNFAYGIHLGGRSANPIQGITITQNVITGCATGAITATHVNNGYFADNALHHNNGFGFDLDTGNNNQINNNHIYENAGFGLRLFSSSATGNDNAVALNTIYNMDWDGIRIGIGMVNTRVLSNTVSNTNRSTGGGFDLGGIALNGTTDTRVEGNTITYVQAGGGTLANTAGVALDGGNVRPIVENNLIINNLNHGIWLSANGYTAGGPVEIHGNSIYFNGRFGIYSNVTSVAADAEGNWWGRNSPRTSTNPAATGYDIFTGLGANVDYTPPIVLSLARAPTAIVADGVSTSNITATMRCATCIPAYNVLNGTLITFTNSLGSLGTPPVVRSTFNGEATVVLQSATIVGRSYITATTPSAGTASTWVDFIAGAPYTITMSATPSSIWSLACAYPGYPITSTIEVTVTDQFGNPCVGQPVTYTLTPGMGANLAWTTGVLDANGYHLTVLNSGNIAGTVLVTVTVGARSQAIPVEVMPGIPRTSMDLVALPSAIAADGVSTATIRATVYDDCQNLAYDGTMVGFVTSHGSLPYRYVEAESAEVSTSADWTTQSNASASGGAYLETNTSGAWASWSFMGSAVSVIYRRGPLGGTAQVLVDGVPRSTISMFSGSVEWQREAVVATGLDPTVPHIIQVNCFTGRVYLDAFRSGTTTTGGVATAILTSARISTTAYITATAVDSRVPHLSLTERVTRTTTVRFQRADLAISKVASPANVAPGGLVTFTLFYTNTGVAQGTEILITDTLPISLTYVSSTSSPDVGPPSNPSNNVWVWHAGNVPPKASGLITFTAQRSYERGLGVVTNTVQIGSLTLDAVPGNNTGTATVNFIPGPAFSMDITATPPVVFAGGGALGRSTIEVTVTDEIGDPVVGRVVTFTWSPGFGAANVTPDWVLLNASGYASTTLTSGGVIGTLLITGTIEGVSRSVPVEIQPASPAYVSLERSPTEIVADGVSTSLITATVRDAYGNLAYDGTMVGFMTSQGTLPYAYVEAESAEVTTSTGWSVVANASASGGSYIQTSSVGASARWPFTGSAVSVVYVRTSLGGQAQIYVDGIYRKTIDMYATSTQWQPEQVIVGGLDPSLPHEIEVRCGSGRVYLDAFRSGTTTVSGVATAVLTSAQVCATAEITATAVEHRLPNVVYRPSNSTTVQFLCTDLAISKGAYPIDILPGEFVTFTLRYANIGRIPATDVLITDTLPSQLTYVGSDSSPVLGLPSNPSDNVWVWSIGDLSLQASGVITITAQRGYISGLAVVTNTAVIDSQVLDSDVGNNSASASVQLVPGPAASMVITATPPSIWVTGGSPTQATIWVTATDAYGNPCAGQVVTFTWSPLGTAAVAPMSRVLRADGSHYTILTSGSVAGTVWVTATVGALSQSVPVQVMSGLPGSMLLDRSPIAIPADGVSTSLLTALVRDGFDNLIYDGTMVGFTTTLGSVPYDYVEAESSPVEKSTGDWSAPSYNINASGHYHIYTDNPGAWASWRFMGSAVSVIYRRDVSGGLARVLIDDVPAKVIDMSAGTTLWRREIVIGGLDPSTEHTIRVECITGRVWLDALRSGTTTMDGVATALLTSAQECLTATVRATAVDSRVEVGPNDLVSRDTTVQFQCAELTISKSVNQMDVAPDELAIFTLYYTNTGRAQATDTRITDTLPSRLTYVSSSSSPYLGQPENPEDNIWVWHVGDMRPGTRGVITLTARNVCQSWLGWVTNTVSIHSLTAETNPENNSTERGVRLVAGPPFTVTVTSSPSHILVNSSSTIRITVTDRCDNPVAGSTVYITTNIGSFSAVGILRNTTRTTDATGRITLTFYSQSAVGMAVITATAGSATGVGYVWINIGPAAQCVAVANPSAIPADGLSTSNITARVLDTAGYIVPDGVLVGFTTSLGSLLYSYAEDPQLTQSPADSWDTLYDAAASGGSYISTTLNGASILWNFYGNGVSIVYRRASGGGWVDIALDGNPLGAINMGGSLTWRAEKVYTWSGDPTAPHVLRVTHRTGTGPVWIDAFRSGVTTNGGQALAVLTSETTAGTAIVAATAISETTGIVPVLLPGFVNVHFDPADLVITKTVEPAGQVSIGQRITFTLRYENRGPITATNAYIEDVIQDGVLSSGWLQDVFFSATPETIVELLHYRWPLGSLSVQQGGIITFGGTVAEDHERYWPSATVLTNTASITSLTVDSVPANNISWVTKTIVPGMPVTMTLTATPRSIPVNCTTSGNVSQLQAEVRDRYGNPVRNGTPVTFTTTLGGFPTAQERVRYTTDGVATVNLTAGTVAGTAIVTATADSIAASTQVVFTPLGPSAVTVTANPDVIPVGGATSVIEAWVTDPCSNSVADGTPVSFSTDWGTIAPAVVGTVNGRASALLVSGTAPVTATVIATADTVSGTTTVRFVPGEPRLSLAAHPLTLPVSNTTRITVTARDEFGNPVLDGTVVTFTTSLGNFTDSGITNTFTTTVGGRAFVALHSTQTGQAVVRATIGAHEAAAIITFEPLEAWTISLTVEPEIILGCGGTALARAVVRDRYGNPVRDGTVVVFNVHPVGRAEPIDGGRTTNGVAQAVIASGAKPGPAYVRAWPAGRDTFFTQVSVYFTEGPPDHFEPGTPAAEPPRLLVGGKHATIRVRVLDCGNYPVAEGTTVTFTLVSGGGSLAPQTTSTSNGWAYATLTSPNETGRATIRVNSGEREGTVTVEYIPEAPFDITLAANPLSIAANGVSTSTIDAEIRDRYGNFVADGIVVVFSTDLGRFETGPSYTTYTSGGRARATLISSTTSGMARVAATAGGKRGETYVDFYFVPTPTPTPTLTPTPTQRWSVRLPMIMKNYRR